MQGMSNTNSNQTQNTRQSTIDVPVRILVPSESVGAIIGKGGQTIRQLTQQTRAKVDVYRGDPMAPSNTLQEKVITIRGQPENCINACREILKVMKTDAESKGKPIDIPLKVLAHNDYIGRIIGKQGNIINTIKKETETSVTVSSINDMSMNVERVITVKGELENMIKALEIIHAKVKSAFENDTKTYGAQAIMMGGIPPLPLAPPAFAAASAAAAAAAAFNAAPPNSAARFAAAAAVAAAAAQHGLPPHQAGGGSSNASGGGAQSGHHSGSNASIQAGSAPSQQSGPGGSAGPGGIATSYGNFYPPNAAIYHQHQQMAGQGASSHAPNQASAANAGGVYSPAAALLPQSQQQQQQSLGANAGGQAAGLEGGPEPETVYLYIPNVAVGAIIGTKGSYIKNIIKLSGASVKITPLSPEESKTAVERQVVIVGTPDSQWKAQYYVYEKIRQERFATDDNVKLKAEIQVPSHIVGRIIGKSGKNVRELQRSTGATIKLPEDITSLNQQGSASSNNVAAAAAQATSTDGNASASSEQTAGGNEQPSGNESNEAAATPATTTTTTATTAASPTEGQTDAQSSSSSSGGAGEQKSGAEASSVSPNGNQNGGQLNSSVSSNGFVTVRIFGTFQASQCAQRRILSLVNQSVRGGGGPQSLMGINHQITPITPIPLINHYHHRDYSHSQPHSNQRTNGGAPYNRRNRQQQQNNNHQQHKEHQQQQHQGNQQQQQQQQNGTASNNGATSSGSQVAANLNNSVGEQSQSGQTNAATAAAQSPSVSSSSSSQPIVAAVSS